MPPSAVQTALGPLVDRPGSTAILTDFDGTLAPIVRLPEEARPLDGIPRVLADLADRYAVVAVISGRPVSFLTHHLVLPRPSPDQRPGLLLVGQYGLERTDGDGGVTVEPAAAEWAPVVEASAHALRATVPPGVLVETKGLAVTVHWRTAPDQEEEAVAAAVAEAERTGLIAHPGRLSLELRPPLAIDKGSVVRSLVAGCKAAVYFGDDLGDLPAFEALRQVGEGPAVSTLCVAVADAESDPVVLESADLVLDGPAEVVSVLRWLARPGS
jgi:trehalose 6-phosphate phosphatase